MQRYEPIVFSQPFEQLCSMSGFSHSFMSKNNEKIFKKKNETKIQRRFG